MQTWLKPLDLVRISYRLTDPVGICELAAHLQVPHYVPEGAVKEHSTCMSEAALKVLQTFRNSVATGEEAYTLIRRALKKCRLLRIDSEVFEKETDFD